MSNTPADRPNLLSSRRRRLVRSVAIVAALLLGAPAGDLALDRAAPANAADAAETGGPASFADVVQKVKPAVISIRVRLKTENPSTNSDENQLPFPKGSPFEKFFKDFGIPNPPDGRGVQQFALAQGSGFFISPDGYAVTNDHVVKNAQSVEVATDDGKSYAAKVVGTDPKTDIAC